MPVRRSRQGTNQAGALSPLVSPWGQTLLGSTPQLIDQPLPIGTKPNNFGGTAGGLITIAASVKLVSGDVGYFGDVPQSEQPLLTVSQPWERP